MHIPQISVIIPVYNVEPYVRKCIDSILNQTFRDFELLLVDDGSTDCSGAICDEYALKDARIRVFHTSNRGVSAARNWGISYADGEYIAFVDSDDFVEKNFLESLYEGKSCDLSFVGINRYFLDNKSKRIFVKFDSRFISKVDFGKGAKQIIEQDLLSIGFAGGKLYTKRIIKSNRIQFDERIKMHEDLLFYYDYLTHCKSIYLSKSICYNYTYQSNATSLSHTLPPYSMLLTMSDNFMTRFPALFDYLGITDETYIKRIISEYGMSSRRAAVYSLYYYHIKKSERTQFFKEQQSIFKCLYNTYGYKPVKVKHLLVFLFTSARCIPIKVKDLAFTILYNYRHLI